jgi:hypothetical protein
MKIDHEMERVGKIIAADQGLDVRVRGTRAYATPGTVTIPNIDTYEWLGADAYRMLHGLLDHECGHANYSDFEALVAWKRARKPNAALSLLQNVLEDGYIERMMGIRYRGCGTNIRRMNEWFFNPEAGREESGEQTLRRGDLVGALFIAISLLIAEHGKQWTIAEIAALRPELHAVLTSIAPEIAELRAETAPKATQHVIDITERIWAKLPTDASSSKPSKRPDTEEGEGEGEDAPQPGDEESEGEGGEGEEKTPGAAEPADGDEDEDADGEGGAGEAADEAEGKGEAADEDMKGVIFRDLERWTQLSPVSATGSIEQKIRSVFEQPTDVQPYTVFSHEFDIERDFSGEDMRGHAVAYEQETIAARAAADSLVFAFEAALRATDTVRFTGGHDEGIVDPEALGDFAAGVAPADQIYMQYVDEDGADVAVAVLCDCSGSMHGRKAALCRRTAIAMHLALSRVQIAHEITGFTTIQSSTARTHAWARGKASEYDQNFTRMREALVEAQKNGTDVSRFSREMHGHHDDPTRSQLMAPIHAIFKSFGEGDPQGLMEIGGYDQNLDGEGVLWQAQRLAQRPEKRRVMFVLSDGCPVGSRDNAQGARYLKESIDRVVASGIEIYGLGMESRFVENYYPVHWVCNDISDLISVAMEGLTDVLLRGRIERGLVTV